MKTALFGGSFNPVHLGHLALAEHVRRCGYNRVLFIPAGYPPHKELAAGASGPDRLAMLKAALGAPGWAEIWPGELRRANPSYSIDTLEELIAQGLAEQHPGLVIGDDLAAGFSQWKDAGRLAASARILLARRSADSGSIQFPYPHRRLENPLWPHSSTEVRRLIAAGVPLASVVSEPVARYIRERGLYGASG